MMTSNLFVLSTLLSCHLLYIYVYKKTMLQIVYVHSENSIFEQNFGIVASKLNI